MRSLTLIYFACQARILILKFGLAKFQPFLSSYLEFVVLSLLFFLSENLTKEYLLELKTPCDTDASDN